MHGVSRMIEYKNFPPHESLVQVLKGAPHAAHTYVELWKMRNKKNQVVIQKEGIRSKLFLSPTILRNRIIELVALGLASLDESLDNFNIRLFEPASKDDIQEIRYL